MKKDIMGRERGREEVCEEDPEPLHSCTVFTQDHRYGDNILNHFLLYFIH